jgi:hypothetical protein
MFFLLIKRVNWTVGLPFNQLVPFPIKTGTIYSIICNILIISDAPARIKFQTIQFHPSRMEITGL